MSRLNLTGQLQYDFDRSQIEGFFRQIQDFVNALSEGRQYAVSNASTAAPTTGAHALGDFVLNSSPSEVGGAGSKYIIHGWRCTAAGTPGTWKECRYLTGN